MLDSLESCSACELQCRHLQRWAQAGYLAVHVSGVQTQGKLQLCQQDKQRTYKRTQSRAVIHTSPHICGILLENLLVLLVTGTVQVVCQLFVKCFSSVKVVGSCTAGFWTSVPVWVVKQALNHRGILFDAHGRPNLAPEVGQGVLLGENGQSSQGPGQGLCLFG